MLTYLSLLLDNYSFTILKDFVQSFPVIFTIYMLGFSEEPKVNELLSAKCPIASTCLPIMSKTVIQSISAGLSIFILSVVVNGLGYNSIPFMLTVAKEEVT